VIIPTFGNVVLSSALLEATMSMLLQAKDNFSEDQTLRLAGTVADFRECLSDCLK
jgi:hypothetical protein